MGMTNDGNDSPIKGTGLTNRKNGHFFDFNQQNQSAKPFTKGIGNITDD